MKDFSPPVPPPLVSPSSLLLLLRPPTLPPSQMISKATLTSLCCLATIRAEGFLSTVGRRYHCADLTSSNRPTFVSTRISLRPPAKVRAVTSLSSTESPENEHVHISIEYCSGCQWLLRSSWIASELLTTFAQETKLASVTLIPKSPPLSPGGIFRVVSRDKSSDLERILWDRSVEGRFPEAKEVKQKVRDVVNPNKDLGHSDTTKSPSGSVDCVECRENQDILNSSTTRDSTAQTDELPAAFYDRNKISIEFSTGPTIYSVDNKMHTAINVANEVLSMVYERNAWWKQNKDKGSDTLRSVSVPASVDEVTLVPIRDRICVMVSDSLHFVSSITSVILY